MIFGVSWGSGLAQQGAFQHPRRCSRLVLVITAAGSLRVPACPPMPAGTDDPIISLVTARMARMLPNSTLHVYPYGHLGLITQAHESAPVVTDVRLS